MKIGNEFGSPVTYDYPASGPKFSGEVNWVEIDLGKDAVVLDHLISPEQPARRHGDSVNIRRAGSPNRAAGHWDS